ncbi:hypothetical protein ACQEU6_18850 [Spirillospora sp. CA-108201]
MRKFVNAVLMLVLAILSLASVLALGALLGVDNDMQYGDDPVGDGALKGAIAAIVISVIMVRAFLKKVARITKQNTDSVAAQNTRDAARRREEERRERQYWKRVYWNRTH